LIYRFASFSHEKTRCLTTSIQNHKVLILELSNFFKNFSHKISQIGKTTLKKNNKRNNISETLGLQ